MAGGITYRDNPNATTAELAQELKRVAEQVRLPAPILGVNVTGNTIFPVAHGLGVKPRAWTFCPHGITAFWFRGQVSDERCIYIFSDSTVTGDFVVFP